MEHFITEIRIHELRHLSDIVISLDANSRQHLVITGKNGSGKTSLLLALRKYLSAVNDGNLNNLVDSYPLQLAAAERKLKEARSGKDRFAAEKQLKTITDIIEKYKDGVDISFSERENLDALYAHGDFITAFFSADRQTNLARGKGVENVILNDSYRIDSEPGNLLQKYMVHLWTQQSYAKNAGDNENAERIQEWFDRFEKAMRILMDDDSITLEYNYKEYSFRIRENGKEPFGFDELSDGYSSVIRIFSDLILRMDKNWLLGDHISEYDIEGIALIDELETHLHIELQKKILPFLTTFFPRVQFIVTTHSPYILNSISNAKAYDLERCVELENLSLYSSEGLAEGYFQADDYSIELKRQLDQYQKLLEKSNLTSDERAYRARLRQILKNIPYDLSPEARERFEDLERERYDKSREKTDGKIETSDGFS
ncbi:MAG: AAA family ATPase [Lachnospiraceae bacterium]|nr:AAA family ATPase [Lachnospiraceae bacterium]